MGGCGKGVSTETQKGRRKRHYPHNQLYNTHVSPFFLNEYSPLACRNGSIDKKNKHHYCVFSCNVNVTGATRRQEGWCDFHLECVSTGQVRISEATKNVEFVFSGMVVSRFGVFS